MSSFFSYLLNLWRVGTCLWIASLSACTPHSLEEDDLRTYAQDPAHGLSQQLTEGSVQATCSYRPTELLVAQELSHTSIPATPTLVDSLRRNYAGKSYFSLSLTQNGAEVENQFITNSTAYTNALAYLNTDIAQDVFLVTEAHDSIPALASVYPRQYGTTGHSTVLLIFDTHEHPLTQDFTLVFQGEPLQLGTLRFPFAADNLAAVPTLKWQ